MNELACPRCGRTSWILDSDFRGMDGEWVPYGRRAYDACAACGFLGRGWKLLQQSPPEFLLQPSERYPLTQAEFDHWLGILRANFPDHPRLTDGGFVPCTPDRTRALREEFERRHPVLEMRDHDGACCRVPSLEKVLDWVDMMRPGEFLLLHRRDGGTLRLAPAVGQRCSAVCFGPDGGVMGEAAALDEAGLRAVVARYLGGDAQPLARRLQ